MILDKYRQTKEKCSALSEHFTKISFPSIAATLSEAANAIDELIAELEKSGNPQGEGRNE